MLQSPFTLCQFLSVSFQFQLLALKSSLFLWIVYQQKYSLIYGPLSGFLQQSMFDEMVMKILLVQKELFCGSFKFCHL